MFTSLEDKYEFHAQFEFSGTGLDWRSLLYLLSLPRQPRPRSHQGSFFTNILVGQDSK